MQDHASQQTLWKLPPLPEAELGSQGKLLHSPVRRTCKGQALITCAVKWKYCREVTLIFLWPSLMLLLCHFPSPWVFKGKLLQYILKDYLFVIFFFF